ncbi:hypothetical protein DSO57_1008371 [Entomophthora muscae]|uniref:Uncharacterized protein n=1 Tax=Entomophthora muscae TaxID=34485 RepID=A0ACC2RYD3_9FUNG|nr:hypothetical protein DSO57_1008371 [Entomophthora muscae]
MESINLSPPEMDTPPNQPFTPYDFSYPALDPWASFHYDQQFLDISLGLNPMCNPMAAHMGNPLGGMVGTPQPEFFQPMAWAQHNSSYPPPQSYPRQQYSMSYPPLMDMVDDETTGRITLSSENNPQSTQ